MNEDFPIAIPPIHNTEAAIIHRETDQKSVGFFQRKVVADVYANLNSTLQDACREIALGPYALDANVKYRMYGYGRVSGMTPSELSAYMLDLVKRYKEWCARMGSTQALRVFRDNGKPIFVMPAKSKIVCTRFCQDEDSIYRIRTDEQVSEKMALKLLQAGLNEYSVHSGWGDQIEGVRK